MKVQKDYSWIRGFNYVPSYAQNSLEFWHRYDEQQVEKELEYAKRLSLNCARVFLSLAVFQSDPGTFCRSVLHFVRCAWKKGIYTIPVVWDSCFSEEEPDLSNTENKWFPNPGPMHLTETEWGNQQEYCDALIRTLSKEPGLLLWDIHNEPLCTSYVSSYFGEEKERHIQTIWKFVRHFCEYFREKDPENAITVGIHQIDQVKDIGPWCDVISFHDYSPSETEIQSVFDAAHRYADSMGKPVFCSEMCCPSRANPYDVAIETAAKNHMGYVLWELMIGRSFWNDRHGIVYPDGSIRDTAAAAAILGFFRNRGKRTEINLETEGILTDTVQKVEKWLCEKEPDASESRKLLQRMANLLEGGELVPLADLPGAQVRALRLPEDMEDARDLAVEWLAILNRERKRMIREHPSPQV